jgi:hydrogenase expression/formation protein HypC
MCLGVPGKVTEIHPDPLGMTMGKVSFGGIMKEVCLAYMPEVEVGDYVVVHVGFAISAIDEEEADLVFRYLESAGELEELEVEQPPGISGSGTSEEELPRSRQVGETQPEAAEDLPEAGRTS